MYLIIIMALIDAFVLSLMKYQLKSYNFIYFVIAVIFYGIQPLLFYQSLKHGGNLAINNVSWDLLSDISVTIIAIYVFKELLTNKQILGLLFGLISIYLMNY